jgi:hypothetical protein
MSDYTPTTNEVREAYRNMLVQEATNIYSMLTPEDADAEFDRWFQSIMHQAHIAERERIIKLLEKHLDSGAQWSLPYQSGVGDSIALIKGDQS